MQSEQVIRQLLQLLWHRHVLGEQQYLYWILGAPLLALAVFLLMWYRHRAHAYSLVDAISFFFAPSGPKRILVFKDLAGEQHVLYDYKVVKGGKGYIVQAGPYLLRTSVDPDSYAEAVSLIDARGPPGVPSPFGLLVRQLIAAYLMIAVIAVAFVNTFYTTYDPYMRYSELIGSVAYTTIDLLALSALVVSAAWIIAVLLRVLTPQTMLVHLAAIGAEEGYIQASPGLDVYSRYPPSKLLRAIAVEPKINVNVSFTIVDKDEREEKKTFWDRLVDEIGDKSLAASLLAMLAQVYDSWRKSIGILLQDRYDISVAARARYQLSEEKLGRGFLGRYAGWLAILALILVVAVAAYMLHPSLGTANNATSTTAAISHTATTTATSITPAQPPAPPGPTVTTHTVTPAGPPAPNLTPHTGG